MVKKDPMGLINSELQEFANSSGDFSGMAPEKLIDISKGGEGREDFDAIMKKAIDNPGFKPSAGKTKVKEAIGQSNPLFLVNGKIFKDAAQAKGYSLLKQLEGEFGGSDGRAPIITKISADKVEPDHDYIIDVKNMISHWSKQDQDDYLNDFLSQVKSFTSSNQ